MKLSDYNHIVIIQTAFIGDVALALYLAQEIRNYHPPARITFVTTPQSAELAMCANAIDEVIVFDKRSADAGWRGIRRIANLLRCKKVDCVFALQRSTRTAILTRMSKAKLSIGFGNATLSWLCDRTVEWNFHHHEVERNRSMLQLFDEFDSSHKIPGVELNLPELSTVFASPHSLSTVHYPLPTVLAPGAVWLTKRWLEEYWIETAKQLRAQGQNVILVGGKDDAELCERIAADSGTTSLAGKLSLPQTLALLKQSLALITNDSAPTHLAGLVGCRTITIFGSTVPEFGFAPRGAHDLVIENKNLKCRPCGIHGKNKCPLGTMECMKSISPEFVLSQLTFE